MLKEKLYNLYKFDKQNEGHTSYKGYMSKLISPVDSVTMISYMQYMVGDTYYISTGNIGDIQFIKLGTMWGPEPQVCEFPFMHDFKQSFASGTFKLNPNL